jgi:magnesium-transporting ATPase (P-type)
MRRAQTLAFTTPSLAQVFNAFNARSERRSAFTRLFANPWLWAAVGLSIALQVAVVYVPFLQRAFSTTALSGGDWLRCTALASITLWGREASKLFKRTSIRFRTRAGLTF